MPNALRPVSRAPRNLWAQREVHEERAVSSSSKHLADSPAARGLPLLSSLAIALASTVSVLAHTQQKCLNVVRQACDEEASMNHFRVFNTHRS